MNAGDIDRLIDLLGRFVLSFEKLSTAMEGISEAYKTQVARQYPERRQVRDATVSRVQTEEDRIREAQGASDKPIDEWLAENLAEEDIGRREREWLERHAGSKASG